MVFRYSAHPGLGVPHSTAKALLYVATQTPTFPFPEGGKSCISLETKGPSSTKQAGFFFDFHMFAAVTSL